MQVGRFLVSLLLVPLPLIPSAAQQSTAAPQPQRDPEALSLLARCSAAMGSPDLATTVYASGVIIPSNRSDPRIPLVLKSKGGDKQLWEMNAAAARDSIVLNGGSGKSIRDSRDQRMPGWQTMYARPEHFPALLCAAELQRQNMDIVYVGLEKVDDNSVHHIKFAATARGKSQRADAAQSLISEFHIFLDAQSFVVLKTQRFAFSPDAIENHSTFETYYQKYNSVVGVLMPFTMTNFLAGEKLQDIFFDDIRLNVGVSDTDFSI